MKSYQKHPLLYFSLSNTRNIAVFKHAGVPSTQCQIYNKMRKKPEKTVLADSEKGQLAGEAIVEAVENQIEQNNPPETKQTLERLMDLGESRENAMRYIACSLSVEIFDAMKKQSPYDEERYIRNLKALPKLPDE